MMVKAVFCGYQQHVEMIRVAVSAGDLSETDRLSRATSSIISRFCGH